MKKYLLRIYWRRPVVNPLLWPFTHHTGEYIFRVDSEGELNEHIKHMKNKAIVENYGRELITIETFKSL